MISTRWDSWVSHDLWVALSQKFTGSLPGKSSIQSECTTTRFPIRRHGEEILVSFFMTKHTLSAAKSDKSDRFQPDLSSELLRARTVMIGPTLDEKNYNLVIARLIFLQQQDPSQEISLWINSDHPSEMSALAICDVLNSLTCDLRTYCAGKAIGVSAILLASGKKGKRTANRNSSICLCQPSIKFSGNADDLGRMKRRIELARDRTADILAGITSRPKSEILPAIDREYWMSADEAREYGVVDHVK